MPVSSYTSGDVLAGKESLVVVQSIPIPNITGHKAIAISFLYVCRGSEALSAYLSVEIRLGGVVLKPARNFFRAETYAAGAYSTNMLLPVDSHGLLEVLVSRSGYDSAATISDRFISMMLTKR